MDEITKSVVNCFEKTGLNFSQLDDESIFQIINKGKNGLLTTYVCADQDRNLIECFTVCPLTAAQTRMVPVFELIAKINCRLAVGNFDIDVKNGEIWFRTSIRLGNIELDYETIAHLIFMNLATTDMFLPVIASVVCSGINPNQALLMLKRPAEQENNDKPENKFGGRFENISNN